MEDRAELTSKQRQAQATRKRLLDAAFEDFQRSGYAGARVDRIAERARSNKRLIYVYFDDKSGLFDAVIERMLEEIVDVVPFEATDLSGYAVSLFDYWEANPEVVRMFWWRNLERSGTSEIEEKTYGRMTDEIASAQEKGLIDSTLPATHVLAFMLGVLQAWAIPSDLLNAGTRDLRRESVRIAIERISPRHPAPVLDRRPGVEGS